MTNLPVKDGLVKRGKTWSYVVRVRSAKTGHMTNQWVGGFATEKEARRARNEARSMVDKGTAVSVTTITVQQYLAHWLEGREGTVRATTSTACRQHVENHIIPAIGHYRLQQLTPWQIEAMYGDLKKHGRMLKRKLKKGEKPPKGTPLSSATVRRIAATLHKALSDAAADRLIPYNPADVARKKLPQVDYDVDGSMKTWTPKQLEKFLASVAGDRLFPLWRVAAWTGMRRGELAGLTWRDVDLDGGMLSVQRARIVVSTNDVRDGKTKTRHGARPVELDAATIAALTAWNDRQQTERDKWERTGAGEWPDHGLVFALQDGTALHPEHISRWFRAHVKASKLPTIRLHDLRHTHATVLLAAGVPVKVVSERLGHSTPAFTMSAYQHILPGDQRRWVQQVADAEKPARRLKVVAA